MRSIPVNLAVEDELSEAVLRRLLADAKHGYVIGKAYGRNGYGYLRKTIAGWKRAAKGIPFVVLTDLDDADCAPSLIGDWLPVPKHPNLVFRVAVREVEAWLLGDTVRFAKYIGCAADKMPDDPDALPNPKRTLVDLASKSRSADIRNRVVPKRGSTAQQGPDYNACLCGFVRGAWSSAESARRSPSLKRALTRLSQFEPTWS